MREVQAGYKEKLFSQGQSSTETHCLEMSYWFRPWMFSEPSWIKCSRSGLTMLLAGRWFQPELSYAQLKKIQMWTPTILEYVDRP